MSIATRLFAIYIFVLMSSIVTAADKACSYISETSIKDVIWTDQVGVETSANSLIKKGPEGWNSAAYSAEYIGDDGALEFTVKGATTSRMLGFSYVNTDERYEWINYAVFLTSYGRLYIFENGVQKGNYSIYTDDDVIRIERKNGIVTYMRNGNKIYVSNIPSDGSLYADVSLYSEDARIDQAKIYGAGSVKASTEWMDLVEVNIEKDILVKTGGTGWNSGAASAQAIPGDGAVEFTVQDNDNTLVFGLSGSNDDADYKRIDYAVYTSANGSFYVYEEGFSKGSFGSYDTGDVFRIERQGTRVIYMRNCEAFYVSKRPSKGRLIMDVALYSKGAQIVKAMMYGVSL